MPPIDGPDTNAVSGCKDVRGAVDHQRIQQERQQEQQGERSGGLVDERDSKPRRHSDGGDGRDEVIMELVSVSVCMLIMRRIMTFNKEIKSKPHIYQIPKHLCNCPEYLVTSGIVMPWPNIIL